VAVSHGAGKPCWSCFLGLKCLHRPQCEESKQQARIRWREEGGRPEMNGSNPDGALVLPNLFPGVWDWMASSALFLLMTNGEAESSSMNDSPLALRHSRPFRNRVFRTGRPISQFFVSAPQLFVPVWKHFGKGRGEFSDGVGVSGKPRAGLNQYKQSASWFWRWMNLGRGVEAQWGDALHLVPRSPPLPMPGPGGVLPSWPCRTTLLI
jgi:hypothetical protein